MNEEMHRWLDAKEHEAKVRRISGSMSVPANKTDAVVTYIRERFGRLGFDAKLNSHCPMARGDDIIDVWCDAAPEVIEKLALDGFYKMIDVATRDAAGIPEGACENVDFDDRSPPSSRLPVWAEFV
jgi:hypothetical protein